MKRQILFSFALVQMLLLPFTSSAANYYWVNGAGNWSEYATHWAKVTNPTTVSDYHDQVPTSMDNVFFGAYSGFTAGNNTVTIDQTIVYCKDMTWTGVTGNPILNQTGSPALHIYGSLTLTTGMTFQFNNLVRFLALTTGKTITCAGKTLPVTFFEGQGGEWTFQDEFLSNGGVLHTKGKIISNNQNITVESWSGGQSGSPISLFLGSSLVTIQSGQLSTGYAPTDFDCGTSHIILQGNGLLSGTASLPFYNVTFSGSGNFQNGNILNKLTFVGSGSLAEYSVHNIHEIEFKDNGLFTSNDFFDIITFKAGKSYTFKNGKTQTISATGIVNFTGLDCNNYTTFKSSPSGIHSTLSKSGASLSFQYLTLQDIHTTGGASFTASNSIDLGNNIGWTLPSPTSRNLYWVGGGGNWSDPNHWASNSGGTGGQCIPTAFDNVFLDALSGFSSGQAVTLNSPVAYCNNMNWFGVVGNPTFNNTNPNIASTIMRIYGSLTLSANMNCALTSSVFFDATSSGKTVTCAGKILPITYFEGQGGEWTFQDEFLSNGGVLHTKGKIISNNQNITVESWSGGQSGSPISLFLGSSLVTIQSGQLSTGYAPTDFDCGTSHIILQGNGLLSGTASLPFYNVTFSGSGNFQNGNILNKLTFVGSGSLAEYSVHNIHEIEFKDNGLFNSNDFFDIITFKAGKSYIFKNGKTQTINTTLNAVGIGGFPIEMKSSILGSQATIFKASGTFCFDFLYLRDMKATGGASFYAGLNSDNVANNTGWLFQACPIILSGKVKTESGAGINNVQLILKHLGIPVNSYTTNTTGNYSFTLTANTNYTLELIKNTNLLNGVTNADVQAIQQHILGNSYLSSPYKIMAANVTEYDDNNSKVIVADRVHVTLLINGNSNPFNVSSWSFIPQSHTFTSTPPAFPIPQPIYPFIINIAATTINYNFIGIKEGDVTGDADPNQ